LTIAKPQNATLIDSISEGYAAINRRPWLVLVPIVLNLYLWFGAQLSFGPLIHDFHDWMRQIQATSPQQTELQAQYDQLLAFSQVDMREPIAIFNYIPTTIYVLNALGTGGGPLGLPMIQALPQLIDGQSASTIEISSAEGMFLAFVLLNAIALPLSVSFLVKVAEAVRGEWMSSATWARRAGRTMLALLGCIGILVGVALALGLPFLFFATLLLWFSPAIGTFALVIIWVALFWIRIYINFAREAIFVSDMGPLRAIYTSFNVVRRNVWGTLGFLGISLVITLGCSLIWQRLAESTIGLIVAIVGSAYVGSGLLAARMAFYRERLRRWQGAPAQPPGLRARN